ncbi:MAG: hypothetical protein KKH12_07360 [Gammaproteobacteria bacterium]|nr:hypothetical protein [Gammaproteobacteria bacterium]MBU1481477.1 hypothetical protein [Gammaproteobacteria bacterium]
MPNTDLTGLFGVTLALFALLVRVPRVQAFPVRQRMALWAAAVVVASIPLWGLSLAGFARGITGDLSITTLLVLALATARTLSGCELIEEENRLRILRAVAIAAVVLYPFALGFTLFDPYRLGYGNLWFMLALLGFTLWSILRYSMLLALVIALAVAAWSAGWYESPNLWDYLFDPWLAVYAIVVQGKYWWAQRGEIDA